MRQILTKLLLLYGIEKILTRSAQYFATGVITGNTLATFQKVKEQLLTNSYNKEQLKVLITNNQIS